MKQTISTLTVIGTITLLLCGGQLLFSPNANAVSEKDLTYMTEQYPPFNFKENGQLKGIAVDLLLEIFKRLGSGLSEQNINLYPWTTGYKRTLEQKNTVLFATTRTPQRESLFKWVGPIAKNETLLLILKGSPVTVNTAEDLKKYRYGVIRNDIGEQLLLQNGISRNNIVSVTKMLTLIQMLKLKRIDAWVYGEYAAKWAIKQAGFNPSDFVRSYVLSTSDLYYAFHKDTPDELIMKFQKALNEVKRKNAQGKSVFDSILERYLK